MGLKMLSVSELLVYLKNLLDYDSLLKNVSVTGEISNFRPHYSGHMYFVLKDKNAQIKCVMFKSRNLRLDFTPDNGMHVVVRGYFSLYEREGQIQLYVEEMQQEGLGALHIAFEKLKEKLKGEGLFESEYKKKLPLMPRKIGVVTSVSGAVINDIRKVVAHRFPTEIVLAPAQVQGMDAAPAIVKAINALQKVPKIDVIIIARGGGSLEDLWAFNTEEVARAVFASTIPVVSAVGHETDFTICDFVADVRAATPSQAAELVVPTRNELLNNLLHLHLRLHGNLKNLADLKRQILLTLSERPVLKYPERMLLERRQHMDDLHGKLTSNLRLTYERKHAILKEKAGRMDALSPLKVLARGYVLCYDTNGNIIKSVHNIQVDDTLTIKVADGNAKCIVRNVRGEDYGS